MRMGACAIAVVSAVSGACATPGSPILRALADESALTSRFAHGQCADETCTAPDAYTARAAALFARGERRNDAELQRDYDAHRSGSFETTSSWVAVELVGGSLASAEWIFRDGAPAAFLGEPIPGPGVDSLAAHAEALGLVVKDIAGVLQRRTDHEGGRPYRLPAFEVLHKTQYPDVLVAITERRIVRIVRIVEPFDEERQPDLRSFLAYDREDTAFRYFAFKRFVDADPKELAALIAREGLSRDPSMEAIKEELQRTVGEAAAQERGVAEAARAAAAEKALDEKRRPVDEALAALEEAKERELPIAARVRVLFTLGERMDAFGHGRCPPLIAGRIDAAVRTLLDDVAAESSRARGAGRDATAASLARVLELFTRGGAPGRIGADDAARGDDSIAVSSLARRLAHYLPAADAPFDVGVLVDNWDTSSDSWRPRIDVELGLAPPKGPGWLAVVKANGGPVLIIRDEGAAASVHETRTTKKEDTFVDVEVERDNPAAAAWSREIEAAQAEADNLAEAVAGLERAPKPAPIVTRTTAQGRVSEGEGSDRKTYDALITTTETNNVAASGWESFIQERREMRDAAYAHVEELARAAPAQTRRSTESRKRSYDVEEQQWQGTVSRQLHVRGALQFDQEQRRAIDEKNRRVRADASLKLAGVDRFETESALLARTWASMNAELGGSLAAQSAELAGAIIDADIARRGKKWSDDDRALERALWRYLLFSSEHTPVDGGPPFGMPLVESAATNAIRFR